MENSISYLDHESKEPCRNIKNHNNQRLSYCCTSPRSFNGKVVLLCSATGVKKEFYSDFAEYLSEAGFKVYTFDYIGIGGSIEGSIKTIKTTTSSWATCDIASMIELVKMENKEAELQVVAHSIGGQILGLAPNAGEVRKIIFVASQTGYFKYWKGFSKIKMICNWYLLLPVLSHLFGYFPSKRLGLFEDLPMPVALEWAKWCRSPGYLFDFHEKNYYHQIKGEALSITFEDDPYGPRSASEWMMHKYSSCSMIYKHYKPEDFGVKYLGHFNYFRKK